MSINSIAALKQNDTLALSELFHQYHQKVYFFILSKSKSSYIAEETTQLTFIKLWNYRHHLDESLPLSQQIFRIARTTLIDVLRKDAVYSAMKQNIQGSSKLLDGFAPMEVKELNEALRKAVQKLSPVRRKVFELSRNHSYSHKEIAKLLSLSIKTVETHIGLALKQLRHLMIWLSILSALFF
ncbi:MAG: sigma-70 family RNA polymerase sigma factor [Chitinophagaceae bacterium]